jgi:aspartate aminotransferase
MRFQANRLDLIQPSPTLAITARAKELRAEGKDIIGFGAGEPDFDTADHIKRAAIQAIDEGQTKYTAVGGTPALKKAVADKFKRENGIEYSVKEVTVSNGGKQVLFNLFLAVLNPGDEVIITAPYWVSYIDLVRIAEGEPVVIQTSYEEGYLLTAEKLKKAITSKTKAIILNSPSNPTGAVYDDIALKALGEVLKQHPEILIVTDDIYEHILYDGLKFNNLITLFPEFKDRSFIVNGVSKAYSMTGWRIGYGAGPADIITNMETMQGQSTSNPGSISQAAALAALTESQDVVVSMCSAFQNRRDLAYRMLSAMPGVRTILPKGAFYIFPDLSEIFTWPKFIQLKKEKNDDSNSRIFCTHLLDHYDVAAVPGIAFGDDDALRISYAMDDESIRKGLERLGNMIHDLHS